jgi:hypothetical protein
MFLASGRGIFSLSSFILGLEEQFKETQVKEDKVSYTYTKMHSLFLQAINIKNPNLPFFLSLTRRTLHHDSGWIRRK